MTVDQDHVIQLRASMSNLISFLKMMELFFKNSDEV